MLRQLKYKKLNVKDLFIYMFVYMYIHTYIYVHTYTCTHIYTYKHTHSGVSTCKFSIHVFNCIKRNNRQLEEPFFYIFAMLSLKSNSRLESLETFHKGGHDTSNNPSRNMIH